MTAPVVIGDEMTAAVYRLAGARTHTPRPQEIDALLAAATSEAELVLITAEYARHLPAASLARARAGHRPLVLVIPDVRDRVPLTDLAQAIRDQLGLGA